MLRVGHSYVAGTTGQCIEGEYLGLETLYGDRSILLRHAGGTASIPIRRVQSLRPAGRTGRRRPNR